MVFTSQIFSVRIFSISLIETYPVFYLSVSFLDFQADASEDRARNVLQSFDDIGQLKVERTGHCGNYKWKVYYRSRPGQQPILTVSSVDLEHSYCQ